MKHIGVIVIGANVFCSLGAMAQMDNPTPPGWIKATNQPCKIWNPEPQPNESVTWSGPCNDGFASGEGILRWTENGKPDAEFDGEYANGKRNGSGAMITPDGQRIEGEWADDEPVAADPNAICVSLMSCVDGSRIARVDLMFWRGGRVQSCVRPVAAVHMTAGHNAFR